MEDVAESLCQIITEEVEFPKPRLKVKRKPSAKEQPVIEAMSN